MLFASTKSLFLNLLILCLVLAAEVTSNLHSSNCCSGETSCLARPKPFFPKSCLDYRKKGSTKDGEYQIYDDNGQSFTVFCDMQSECGNAWTLVMSWSNTNRALAQFRSKSFKENAPVNENAPNWNVHRQTLARMQSIKSHSTHWRSTCSYPTHGVDYIDYVRANFKDFDVMNFNGRGICKKVEYVNIRGHVGVHTTSRWWQVLNTYFAHIDSSHNGCAFVPVSGSVSSEDNFGYHVIINPKFRCTANNDATTQWWFGGHL